jgi:hypothetical protein
MKTKKINVEFEQVEVVDIMLDLGDLDNYMSKFLALKNHERHTQEILQVRGFDGSNSVNVVILLEEGASTFEQVERCKDYIEQFGNIVRYEVTTAWILNKDANGIDFTLDYVEWYIY